MVARAVLNRCLRTAQCPALLNHPHSRYLTTSNILPRPPTSPSQTPPQSSWLTRKVRESPTAKRVFLKVANALGYGSPKQVAARRAFDLYRELCAVRAEEEREFWINGCDLPPTFQSWFTITNLHVWILTVRLRALPKPHGIDHIQGLIDHFFLDVEDRIRYVLQPGATGLAPPPNSSFYASPTPSPATLDPKGKRKGRAPERLVTQQMKIFREQWAGMGLSCDLGLIKGDTELAGAMWRNLLGARGARGIAFDPSSAAYRRSVNLVGGAVENVAKIDKRGLEVEEARDDNSGVHDFMPSDVDKYVKYPELMVTLVEYLRKEVARLEKVSDQDIMVDKAVSDLRFQPVKSSLSQ